MHSTTFITEMHSEKAVLIPPGNLSDYAATTFFRAVRMCHKSSIRNILDVYPQGVCGRLIRCHDVKSKSYHTEQLLDSNYYQFI